MFIIITRTNKVVFLLYGSLYVFISEIYWRFVLNNQK